MNTGLALCVARAMESHDHVLMHRLAREAVSQNVPVPQFEHFYESAVDADEGKKADILMWWAQQTRRDIEVSNNVTMDDVESFCRHGIPLKAQTEYAKTVLNKTWLASCMEKGDLFMMTFHTDPVAMWVSERRAPNQMDIKMLFVRAKSQKRGYGKRAVRHMIDHAPEAITVWTVEPLNDSAVIFWRRMGFKRVRDDLFVFQK